MGGRLEMDYSTDIAAVLAAVARRKLS